MRKNELVDLLRSDLNAWNELRIELDEDLDSARVDLSGADLRGAMLSAANLSDVDLIGADLREAKLEGADLRWADLDGANLGRSNLQEALLDWAVLRKAVLDGAELRLATLTEADLVGASLRRTGLTATDLCGADLTGANLIEANFSDAHLRGALFSSASFAYTVLDVDMSKAVGFESARFGAPNWTVRAAIAKSGGRLPPEFLRGCGLADWEIENSKLYDLSLPDEAVAEIQNRTFQLRCSQPLQIRHLFISYSHANGEFVDALEQLMVKKGIHWFRDTRDATAGRLDSVLEHSMSGRVVLLVLSKESLDSDWVEHEANLARKQAKRSGSESLCPIALDDSWKDAGSWDAALLDQVKKYVILDSSKWRDECTFEAQFERLIKGLRLFFNDPTPS